MVEPDEFAESFRRFLEAVLARTDADAPGLSERVLAHLGAGASELPIVAHEVGEIDHPNLQLALDEVLARDGWQAELVGVRVDQRMNIGGFGLSSLTAPTRQSAFSPLVLQPGPVQHVRVAIDELQTIDCVTNGLYLVTADGSPMAATLSLSRSSGMELVPRLEVVGPDGELVAEFIADVRRVMRERNVYRGRAISVARQQRGGLQITVERLREVARDQIVLADDVLERIERHVLAPIELRDQLLESRRHLKRGLLLYGPPGTGKTLTSMYLAARMPGRTIVILTGQGMQAIEPACRLARELQPSMVILEDIDLIAQERTHPGAVTPLLFELLNQIDGLAEDADVIFLLTSNRPDLLEPALAARPGRVDQAIELPFPDAAARRRLLELYARGLDVERDSFDSIVERTDGVSAAFIKELLRRASVLAGQRSGDTLRVQTSDLDTALVELLDDRSRLTDVLFGSRRPGTG